MANLHFNNKTLDNRSDHLFKIRPILDAFVEKFCAVYCPDEHISVDESLMKYHKHLESQTIQPN